MAKKKDKKKKNKGVVNFPGFNFNDVDLVKLITENTNKKGNFTCNKKKRRVLKPACVHNRYIKNGKKNPYIMTTSKGRCYCKICKVSFPASYFNQEEVNDRAGKLAEVVSQSALMNQALGGDKKTTNFIAATAYSIDKFPNVYKNLADATKKKDRAKKNNGKKRVKKLDDIGGWEIGKR